MPRQIYACNLFFALVFFVGRILVHFGIYILRFDFGRNVEQRHLSAHLCASLFCYPVHNARERGDKHGALFAETVERARKNKRFHHATVYKAFARSVFHAADKLHKILILAVAFALLDNLVYNGYAHAFYRAHAYAYTAVLDGVLRARLVDAGRQNGYFSLFDVRQVVRKLVQLVYAVVKNSRKILDGIVAF